VVAWLALGLVLIAAVAWWIRRPRKPAIEPGWSATAVVLAGNGVAGWTDGAAWRARFSDPFGVAVARDGTVYVADAGESQRIRRITPDGFVSTIAGGERGFADGPAAAAHFDTPSGLALDATGAIVVADTGNNAIRRIAPDGSVTTIAGDGTAGHRDGPAAQARFNGPIGVAVDATGRILVADTYNDRIRAIDPGGRVTTIAGSGDTGLLDGPAAQAQFDTPCGLAIDGAGTIYVADTGNGVVRRIDSAGNVSTPAGLLPGHLDRPVGIAVDPAGNAYVADERGQIVEMSREGATRTIAGSVSGFADGPGTQARFRQPAGIAFSGQGRLIVADTGNALVRLVAAPSALDLLPPASSRVAPRFEAEAFRMQPLLWPVAPMDGPHEIAGTMGEARGEEAERFHSGIDIRVDEGTLVRAVRDGVVATPLATGAYGTLNEWLRVGPLAYVHIRAGRSRRDEVLDDGRFVPTVDEFGALIRMRVKRGARFRTGELIGSVNRFNHVHVNVGWPGDEHNPLTFRLVRFEDTKPPTIAQGGVLLVDQFGQPFARRARGRVLVWGPVRVVVDAWDQADGNRPSRRLGLYALGYKVLNRDGSVVPGFEGFRETIQFDRLASDSLAPKLIYGPGSGIPFYRRGRTRFLYVVTNTLRDGAAAEGFWDASSLAPADYVLRVRVSDASGNSAVRDLAVSVVPPIPH
jgi:sugar lactone lactonase YvrE